MKKTQSAAGPIPADLVRRIDDATADLDTARARLAAALAAGEPLPELRRAHADVRHAYEAAEALLRRAAALAKPHSYREWSRWRHRVCSLSTQRVAHLFAEQDLSGLRPIGSVRAIDTGMTGPAIGDLIHGRSREPGAPATYGLDLEALLTGSPEPRAAAEERATGAVVIDLHPTHAGSTPDAA
jgi:hypothetical protein